MGELPFSIDPLETDAIVTVKDIEYEIGTLIEEHANEFPLENREAVIGNWISQEMSMALGKIQYDRQPYEFTFTDEMTTLLKVGVIYAVCFRCIKRMHMNRSPELPSTAISRAGQYFRDESSDIFTRLNILLNGSKEYVYETPDHLPTPTADAGDDQSVSVGATVTFDGSGSTDHKGIYEYMWTFIYEDNLRTLYDDGATYTFNVAGVYEVTLTVTDYDGFTDEDRMYVTVT